MKHPLSYKSGIKTYFLAWIAIAAVHALLLYEVYNFEPLISLADSLVSNILFAVIAQGIWFPVNFASTSRQNIVSLLATHVIAAGVMVYGWQLVSEMVLRDCFESNSEYCMFLTQSSTFRFIIGAAYYVIVAMAFYLFFFIQDTRQHQSKESELQSLLKESELNMLKSQINPHFIFNSLNSVSALTLSAPEKAQEMVIKLSEFFRFSVGKESTELNSLREELTNASLYLDIEKVRFGDKLVFESKVSEKCLEAEIPNLILQPLFENAVKYGVSESFETVTISLACEPKDALLEISISNNYDSKAIVRKGKGIGLNNIRQRLYLVYGRTDLLLVDKNDDTFKVTLKIPQEDRNET